MGKLDRLNRKDDRKDRRQDRRDDRREDRIERNETGITRWEQNAADGSGLGSGNTKEFFRNAAIDIGGELIGPFIGELTGIPEFGNVASNIYGNMFQGGGGGQPYPGTGHPNDDDMSFHTATGGGTTDHNCSCQRPGSGNPTENRRLNCLEKAAKAYEKAKADCENERLCDEYKKIKDPCKKKKKTTKKKTSTKKKTTKKKTTVKPHGIMGQCFR